MSEVKFLMFIAPKFAEPKLGAEYVPSPPKTDNVPLLLVLPILKFLVNKEM